MGPPPRCRRPRPSGEARLWRISELHANLHTAEIGWQRVLCASKFDVLEVTYEDIASFLARVVRTIADFADVAVTPDFEPVATYVRQADGATDAFGEAWTRATGGCRLCNRGESQP